ncbi:MAG: MaoC family dehydratase [bacterium]|nr:MaoC family dehydratase [bacterium]
MSSVIRTFASFSVGDIASLSHTVTAKDVASFASVSGDHNELHTDASYAGTTQFGQEVVHGMFLGALVSQLVGMQLPGKYCLLVKETLEFKKPVFIGDTVVVTGKISRKTNALQLLDIAIDIKRDTDVVATGTVIARVLQ